MDSPSHPSKEAQCYRSFSRRVKSGKPLFLLRSKCRSLRGLERGYLSKLEQRNVVRLVLFHWQMFAFINVTTTRVGGSWGHLHNISIGMSSWFVFQWRKIKGREKNSQERKIEEQLSWIHHYLSTVYNELRKIERLSVQFFFLFFLRALFRYG